MHHVRAELRLKTERLHYRIASFLGKPSYQTSFDLTEGACDNPSHRNATEEEPARYRKWFVHDAGGIL